MRDKFLEIAFRKKTMVLIEHANQIIAEYQASGFTLTVRQLYYQFVARDLIKNTPQNYERVASVVDDARKAGLIDWNAIEDRTRFLRRIPTFDGASDFIEKELYGYAEDIWRDQDYYVEIWIEKDALLGVIEQACAELRVPYFACRGYPSSSELYKAGKRLRRKAEVGQWPIVFYLGDHDPSGLQMTVNADMAVQTYGRTNRIEMKPIALTYSQIEEYNPPPNYVKEGDSRTEWYCQRTGTDECWELDALDPGVIDQLIRDEVSAVLDRDKFDANIAIETFNRAKLRSAIRYLDHGTPAIDSELLRRSIER